MGDDWDYQVRHRAYELWNEAGRPDGKHLQFWEAAEQELKRTSADPAATSHDPDILDARPYDKPSEES